MPGLAACPGMAARRLHSCSSSAFLSQPASQLAACTSPPSVPPSSPHVRALPPLLPPPTAEDSEESSSSEEEEPPPRAAPAAPRRKKGEEELDPEQMRSDMERLALIKKTRWGLWVWAGGVGGTDNAW